MVLETVFDVLVDGIGLGVRRAVEKLTDGTEKVDDALRAQRKEELVEILLCAVWYDNVLTDHERAVVLDELRKVEASELVTLFEGTPGVDDVAASKLDEAALEARVRGLAEVFTAEQRAHTLAAVERVLRTDPSPEAPADRAGPYRRAARPDTERTLALFRRALIAP